jgi:hypothetical protein
MDCEPWRQRMDIIQLNLVAIRRRAAAAASGPWEVVYAEPEPYIRTAELGGNRLFIRREADPADVSDLEFVAHSRVDVQLLVDAIETGLGLDECRLAEIEARVNAASPGPWQEFLASQGGLGGDSVVWITTEDQEPDMYLWRGDKVAPDADIDFIAHARQDVPALLLRVRRASG